MTELLYRMCYSNFRPVKCVQSIKKSSFSTGDTDGHRWSPVIPPGCLKSCVGSDWLIISYYFIHLMIHTEARAMSIKLLFM